MKYVETKIFSKKNNKNYHISPPYFLTKSKFFFLLLIFLLVIIVFFSILLKSKTLNIPEQQLYGVVIGDFATENSANHYATICQARGGAGGIYKDGDKYLLFVAVYSSFSDADSVANNLLEKGERAYVYKWTLPEIKLALDKGSKNMIMAKEVTEIFWQALSSVLDVALAYDKDLKGIGEVSEEIETLKETTDQAILTAEKIRTKETENIFKEVLIGLAYQKTVLSQLEKNNLKKLDLKIAYFDLLLLNISLRQELIKIQ